MSKMALNYYLSKQHPEIKNSQLFDDKEEVAQ